MDIDRLRKYNRALEVINTHFKAIVDELADEIVQNEEALYLGKFGGGDEILQAFQHQLYRVEQARCALLRAARQTRKDIQMRNKDIHLKAEEFLCLSCRNVIRQSDERCSECGWTWEA